MASISYRFADGHFEEVECTDEFRMAYKLIDDEFNRNEDKAKKRAKRKHVSLERIMASDWDIEDENAVDPLEAIIEKERLKISLIELADFLTQKQKQIMKLYYEVGYTKAEIAKQLSLDPSTVRESLIGSIKKIIKYFYK